MPNPFGGGGSSGIDGSPAPMTLTGFGTPFTFGTPTSHAVEITDGRLCLEVQASGIADAAVGVPLTGALAANGILARIASQSWGNAGMTYPFVYAKSAAGLFVGAGTYGNGTWQMLRVNAAFTVFTNLYNQVNEWQGEGIASLRKVGTDINGHSGSGVTVPLWTEAVANHLLDVAEYGVILRTTVGYWGRVEYDLVRPA